MLSARKFKDIIEEKKVTTDQLAACLVRGSRKKKDAVAMVKNWQNGLFAEKPSKEDLSQLATALSTEANGISEWKSSCMYAPFSARKARLSAALIPGRKVQDALDVLKFTNKRAARIVEKVLKAAIADADEHQADVDKLYVSESRVDDAGVRIGTKRWMAKDRGKAFSIRKLACHVHVTVTEA